MAQKMIGKAIKQWRTGRGLTQRGLAERTGLHHMHIGRLERGEGNPRVSTLETLAKAFRKRMVNFFTPPAKAKRTTPQRARRRGR
jgi:transcriptional regulator with XRE-family HTH domain